MVKKQFTATVDPEVLIALDEYRRLRGEKMGCKLTRAEVAEAAIIDFLTRNNGDSAVNLSKVKKEIGGDKK